jgi:hypothetical protein
MTGFDIALISIIVLFFVANMVVQYKRYQLQLKQLDDSKKESTEKMAEYKKDLSTNAGIEHQKQAYQQYKKQQLDQELNADNN